MQRRCPCGAFPPWAVPGLCLTPAQWRSGPGGGADVKHTNPLQLSHSALSLMAPRNTTPMTWHRFILSPQSCVGHWQCSHEGPPQHGRCKQVRRLGGWASFPGTWVKGQLLHHVSARYPKYCLSTLQSSAWKREIITSVTFN